MLRESSEGGLKGMLLAGFRAQRIPRAGRKNWKPPAMQVAKYIHNEAQHLDIWCPNFQACVFTVRPVLSI